MSRLLVPTRGPKDWRDLLANPERQWMRWKSAFEMAASWEAAAGSARGLPPDVALVLDSHEALRGATLLLGAPEHQVRLPGGGHASQTDLWALLRTERELVSVAIEGKAGEPFGERVADWLDGAAPRSGKPERLRFLRERLGLSEAQAAGLRYQLLHRSVSALLEAERFTAKFAALVVQSFGPADDAGSLSDFVAFGRCFAVELHPGRLSEVKIPGSTRLFLGWAVCAFARSDDSAAM